MRKLIISILAILYISTSSGATINLHYCMGKLVNWSFESRENHLCDNCGMKKKDGCCKEESRQFKIATDQKPSSGFILNAFEAEPLTEITYDGHQILNFSNGLYYQAFNNGPPAYGIAIYKYLRVFRI